MGKRYIGRNKGASAISDRSGWRFPMSEMVIEKGTGWLVHKSETDGNYSLVAHPLNNVSKYLAGKHGDPFPVPNARPEQSFSGVPISYARVTANSQFTVFASPTRLITAPQTSLSGECFFTVRTNGVIAGDVIDSVPTMSGEATVEAEAFKASVGASNLSGEATLAAEGTVAYNAQSAMWVLGSITAIPGKEMPGASVMNGVSQVSGSITTVLKPSGDVTLTGTASLLAASDKEYLGSASLTGVATINTGESVEKPAFATMSAEGTVVVDNALVVVQDFAFATLNGEASVSSSATRILQGESLELIRGEGYMINWSVGVTALSTMSGSASLTADSIKSYSASATLSGEATLYSYTPSEFLTLVEGFEGAWASDGGRGGGTYPFGWDRSGISVSTSIATTDGVTEGTQGMSVSVVNSIYDNSVTTATPGKIDLEQAEFLLADVFIPTEFASVDSAILEIGVQGEFGWSSTLASVTSTSFGQSTLILDLTDVTFDWTNTLVRVRLDGGQDIVFDNIRVDRPNFDGTWTGLATLDSSSNVFVDTFSGVIVGQKAESTMSGSATVAPVDATVEGPPVVPEILESFEGTFTSGVPAGWSRTFAQGTYEKSTAWSTEGSSSYRHYGFSNNNGNFNTIYKNFDLRPSQHGGKTLLKIDYKIDAMPTGTIGRYQLQIYLPPGNQYLGPEVSTTGEGTMVFDLSTVTTESDLTNATITLYYYNGAGGVGGDIYWDNLRLE